MPAPVLPALRPGERAGAGRAVRRRCRRRGAMLP